MKYFVIKTVLALIAASPAATLAADIALLNVSYDPTRELYADVNKAFAAQYKKSTGDTVTISQSHGGSGKQARSVIDGLRADIVTLALAHDIDAIAEKGRLLPTDWQKRLPNNSAPYTSTIVFLVRKGNPKNIKDWDDLVKPGVGVIPANPKTSGAARWTYLAAWSFAKRKFNGDESKVREFVKQFYLNAPVLDSGARGATTTFAQRGIGDALVTWENEALQALDELGSDKLEIVAPSLSIVAEPPVALVDKNTRRKGTAKVAEAYLKFLYTEEAQELIAKHHYRPFDKAVAEKHASKFAKIELVTVDAEFGGWKKATARHFGEDGEFDRFTLGR